MTTGWRREWALFTSVALRQPSCHSLSRPYPGMVSLLCIIAYSYCIFTNSLSVPHPVNTDESTHFLTHTSPAVLFIRDLSLRPRGIELLSDNQAEAFNSQLKRIIGPHEMPMDMAVLSVLRFCEFRENEVNIAR